MEYKVLKFKRVIGNSHWKDNGLFVVVEAEDEKLYQIKLNPPNIFRGNVNELIGNFIGKIIEAPVMNGNFINMQGVLQRIKNSVKKIYNKDIDIDIFKNEICFGVEWNDGLSGAEDFEDFFDYIKVSENKDDFYKVFSYDQYLKNADRHYGNFLIVKEENKKPKTFWFIDSDRLFYGLKGKDILLIRDDFNCLKYRFYRFLYNNIDDLKYTKILKHSFNIELIDDKEIDKLMEYILNFYNLSKKEIDIIKEVLTKRKLDFYNRCLSNHKCFPNIKEKRLSEYA